MKFSEESKLRRTGINALGNLPWGSHFCHFYETKQDLLDILVPYFKAGLEDNEFCLWVISEPLRATEATKALREAVPDLERHLARRSIEIFIISEPPTDTEATAALREAVPELERYVAAHSIEIVPHNQWYLDGDTFDGVRVINSLKVKLQEALARGYAGMRVHGNEAWLTDKDWKHFLEYEQSLNDVLAHQRMIVLCTYPLASRRAGEIFDVAHAHEFAIAKRHGHWEMLETPELKKTKTELAALKEELESRVHQRTKELAAVNQKLEESQRKLEEAQRIAHVGHWERDLKTDLITWSGETYRIFGLPPEGSQMYFQDFLKLVHPDERTKITHSVEEALSKLRHYSVEYRIVRADGEERFVHSEGEVVRDNFDRPLRAFGTVQDITERKQSEVAIRKSERQLRLAIDTIPAMAWTLLPDGTLDFVNRRWLEYTGLSLKEAIEQPMRTMHPEDVPRALEKWARDRAAGRSFEDEMRLRRADGEYCWFLVRTVPQFDEQGNILKWYGTSTDVEDRKRAEEALRETQAVLAHVARASIIGELTASIAHEVNQPLGGIVTNAEAALRWLSDDSPNLDEAREALQRIVRDGSRASEVVARIRSLLQSGKTIKTRFGLDEVIREIVALTKAEAQRRRVSVQTWLGPDLPQVTADRVQVQQVLMNLVMNSLDALSGVADRPRILTIQAGTDSPRSVRVAVQDTGPGIDPQRTKDIFEPFYTTKPHGLGLGLCISRSIIEAHGGRLRAIPNEGPGVTFQFTLPANDDCAT